MATRRQLWSQSLPHTDATGDDQMNGIWPLLAIGAGLVATSVQAAEPEPLDEEFLEYLAQLEGEQEDWTWFDADDAKPVPAKPAAPKPVAGKELPAKPTPPKAQTEIKR